MKSTEELILGHPRPSDRMGLLRLLCEIRSLPEVQR